MEVSRPAPTGREGGIQPGKVWKMCRFLSWNVSSSNWPLSLERVAEGAPGYSELPPSHIPTNQPLVPWVAAACSTENRLEDTLGRLDVQWLPQVPPSPGIR